MSTDPDQIRTDIERTRAELSSDVNALTDKVSPAQAAQRQADKVRSVVSDVKDKVMGGVDSAGSAASTVGDAAAELPQTVRARARGNPLAAGLVSFGAGWLLAALLPSSRPEQQLAQAAKEQAAPMVQQAKEVAQDVADNLKEPAQEAAAAVKERAAEAGSTLRDEGRSAADDLRGEPSAPTERIAGGDLTTGVHAAEDRPTTY